MPTPSVFRPVEPGNYRITPFRVFKEYTVTNTTWNLSGSDGYSLHFATHQNEKRGEAAFYGMLIKLAKKSKFYPHAGNNEVELHGKIVFTKAFDEVRNKRVNLKKYKYDYKGWPKHVKEFNIGYSAA